MPKFFKKDKKTEEETPAKVEKPFRAEEPAAEDWMHETKTNAKKKVSDKDKKASLIEKETESTARIQSLEEENKTLQSHVDELEQNFNRILDLQNEVQSLKSLLDERDSLHDELMQVTNQCKDLQTNLDQTKLTLHQTKSLSDKLQSQVQDLTKQFTDEKTRSESYQKEVESLQTKSRQLETEKNTLKEKNDTLLKERARICAGGKQIQDIEKIIDEHADLVNEVETLKGQKKRLNDDLVMTTQKLAITANSGHNNGSGLSKDHGAEALRQALLQKVELERLVAEMTEYVKSKETQMATVKDVNRQLAEQLQMYRSKYENDE